jgi:DnaJ like chaperone protein
LKLNIWGKLIGGFLGLLLFNIIGLILGVWLGHRFDQGLNQNFDSLFGQTDPAETQKVFFTSTFAIMGHIAKADGVVSKQEIAAAEQVMSHLGLDENKRRDAINAFEQGKSSDFNLNNSLQSLIQHCVRKPSLIQMFLEIQILAATADGDVSEAERQILYQIGHAFRISPAHLDRLVEMVKAQQSFHQHGSSVSRNQNGPTLEQAYKVLGLDSNASKPEVKKAYRKLMSQHHPDKLVAKGMPEEMLKVATEKSQEIQAAYEMIKRETGQ